MKKKYLIVDIIILVVLFGGLVVWHEFFAPITNPTPLPDATLIATVNYACDGGKTINASYYQGKEVPTPAPGERPTPTGSVSISLDGLTRVTLAQTISGSGIRYANSDESLVFWSKGDEALILRDNNMDLAYTNCLAQK